MSKQKKLNKQIIENSLRDVLVESFGISEEDAKSKKIWFEQLWNDELSAVLFLEFFEEFITDNLGVKNINSFNKKNEYGEIYDFLDNATNNVEIIEYFYKVMMDNY